MRVQTSDYGSGSSDNDSPWGSPGTWSSFQLQLQNSNPPSRTRSSSSIEAGATGKLEAVMQEFRMNGSDSPYDPEEDYRNAFMGMGPSSAYLRQKSWPAPDSTPSVSLPRTMDWSRADEVLAATQVQEVPNEIPVEHPGITEYQMRVLRSLPNTVLYSVLRELEQSIPKTKPKKQEELECRFCRNNGERESYYRSHALRAGGRVRCPVLRAFVCRRCGARGDHAHTLKYCPLTTEDERNKSAAMMRSLRTAGARRRATNQDFVMFGETTPSVIADGNAFMSLPLHPLWAALEQKLTQ